MTQSTQPADMSKSDAVIDKYEAIRKALEDYEAWRVKAPTTLHVDPATLTSLLADADRAMELEADARRYRWLRSRPLDGNDDIWIACDSAHIANRWGLGGVAGAHSSMSGPDACDAAIDAAIDRAQGETR